ncbi:MAG: hypothetical protein AAF502_22040 [Bacteroidota bacterium]
MKKSNDSTLSKVGGLTATVLFVFFSSFLLAQPPQVWSSPNNDQNQRTLLGTDLSFGYFWGLDVNMAIQDDIMFIVGGKVAWVINNSVAIGGGGYGFFSEYTNNGFGQDFYFYGGYGGIYIEPILGPNFPVHLSFPTLLGGGSLELENEPFFYDVELFIVAEPGMSLEFNVSRGIRFGFNIKHRFTSRIDADALDEKLLHGWSGGLTMKFGSF